MLTTESIGYEYYPEEEYQPWWQWKQAHIAVMIQLSDNNYNSTGTVTLGGIYRGTVIESEDVVFQLPPDSLELDAILKEESKEQDVSMKDESGGDEAVGGHDETFVARIMQMLFQGQPPEAI